MLKDTGTVPGPQGPHRRTDTRANGHTVTRPHGHTVTRSHGHTDSWVTVPVVTSTPRMAVFAAVEAGMPI